MKLPNPLIPSSLAPRVNQITLTGSCKHKIPMSIKWTLKITTPVARRGPPPLALLLSPHAENIQ
jgi:hypothetical protein